MPEGTRIFGYLPPASHLVVQPDRSDPLDFVDESPHRANLPAAYNRYIRVAGMPLYEEENEDQQMLLWPLYFTSFLIDDFLDDESMFGTQTAVLSSASSRTSSALAYLLSRRDGIEVIGLTSHGNVEFTESLGVYDRVIPYEELTSIDRKPAVYVDMSGDAKVRSSVHGHFGDELKHSSAVGITHREDLGGGSGLEGPKPVFFFAPDRLRKRTADWGPEGLNEHIGEAWSPYVEWTRGWLRVEHGSGEDDVERVYRELLDGKSDPASRTRNFDVVRVFILACFLAAALAGCGSSSGGAGTATGPTQAAITSPPATTSAAATTGRRSHLACAPLVPDGGPTSPRPAPHAHAGFWHATARSMPRPSSHRAGPRAATSSPPAAVRTSSRSSTARRSPTSGWTVSRSSSGRTWSGLTRRLVPPLTRSPAWDWAATGSRCSAGF